MAKQRATKKASKPTPRRKTTARAPTVGTVKGGIVVGRDIKAGRDVIMGDQYNDLRQQVAQIGTPQEFVARAQEVQRQIATLRQHPELTPAQVRRIETVEADVDEIIQEAQKPQPAGKSINDTLDGAKETMNKLSESVKAAIGLGTVLGGLGQIALKLFGG